jgi:hypothetical protein
MQPLRTIAAAGFLGVSVSSGAYGQSCETLSPPVPGTVLVQCIAQLAKELKDLKTENEQQAKEIKNLMDKYASSQKDVIDRVGLIAKRLFGDVDSVYTVAADYDLGSPDIRKTVLYIYADPKKHSVRAVINPIGVIPMGNELVSFTYDLSINHRSVYEHAGRLDEDITDKLSVPMQGTGGGGRQGTAAQDFALAYPEFVQSIEIRPRIPPDQVKGGNPQRKGKIISIQGYILVERKESQVLTNDGK